MAVTEKETRFTIKVKCSHKMKGKDYIFQIREIENNAELNEHETMPILEAALVEYYVANNISLRQIMRNIKSMYKALKKKEK